MSLLRPGAMRPPEQSRNASEPRLSFHERVVRATDRTRQQFLDQGVSPAEADRLATEARDRFLRRQGK